MDVPADTRVNTLSKQRMVLIALLVVSVIGNAVWIMKASSTPPKPVVTIKKEDIEVRGTITSSKYLDSVPNTFEGTVTNTSKVDAPQVALYAIHTSFDTQVGHQCTGFYIQPLTKFQNLRAGETRTFRIIAPKQIDKSELGPLTDDYPDARTAYGLHPKLDWEVTPTPQEGH